MISLPDLLELLVGAGESFQSVRVTIRNWRNDEKAMEAFERSIDEDRRRQGGSGGVGIIMFAEEEADEEPGPSEQLVRLWFEPPDRMRVEVEGRWGYTQVSDGRREWNFASRTGAIVYERGEPVGSESALLLNPAALLPGLELEPGDMTVCAGREAIEVRARPRPVDPWDAWHDSHGLTRGADVYELLVDVERGVLLRAAAVMDGESIGVSEVLEIAFDEQFDPDCFVFTPPPGELVRTPEEAYGNLIQPMSVEDAATQAPFSVFVATGLEQGWRMDVHFHAELDRPPTPASVSIHYVYDREPMQQFTLSQQADGQPPTGGDWERVERDGQVYDVLSPAGATRGWPTMVRCVREGTRIQLTSSGFGRDRLLEIAESLVPAPTEPPPLWST